MAERRPGAIRRRIAFEPATWHALHRLAKDRMETIQELADEAFRGHAAGTTTRCSAPPLVKCKYILHQKQAMPT